MTEQAIPQFGTVARTDLPKRQGPKRERTAEEIALRDALWSIISTGNQGAVDPVTYKARNEAVNASNRYRSLLAPNLADGQRIETRIVGDDASGYTVTVLLGTRKADEKPRGRKPNAKA